jgi:predicted ATP-dependent endonuclease of OLD family
MRTATTIAICLLLASRAALCGEPNVEQLSKELSELKSRVSKTEDALWSIARSLVAAGYYNPEKDEQQAERRRLLAAQRAEFEAMSVDRLEDLILDLEDQLARAEKQEKDARDASRKASRGRRPAQGTSQDREQRKAALREQFAALRAYNEGREKIRAIQSRLRTVRSVWEKKASESPNTEASELQKKQ